MVGPGERDRLDQGLIGTGGNEFQPIQCLEKCGAGVAEQRPKKTTVVFAAVYGMMGGEIHEFGALAENPLDGSELFFWVLFGFVIGMFVDGLITGHDAVGVSPVFLI